MKNALLAFLLVGTLASCEKKESASPAKTSPTLTGTFSWKENGQLITADSAWYNNRQGANSNATYTNVYAQRGGSSYFFEISIDKREMGVFHGTDVTVSYIKGTKYFGSTDWEMTFSDYDQLRERLSGSFSATVKDANSSIQITEGTFTDLSKKD